MGIALHAISQFLVRSKETYIRTFAPNLKTNSQSNMGVEATPLEEVKQIMDSKAVVVGLELLANRRLFRLEILYSKFCNNIKNYIVILQNVDN